MNELFSNSPSLFLSLSVFLFQYDLQFSNSNVPAENEILSVNFQPIVFACPLMIYIEGTMKAIQWSSSSMHFKTETGEMHKLNKWGHNGEHMNGKIHENNNGCRTEKKTTPKHIHTHILYEQYECYVSDFEWPETTWTTKQIERSCYGELTNNHNNADIFFPLFSRPFWLNSIFVQTQETEGEKFNGSLASIEKITKPRNDKSMKSTKHHRYILFCVSYFQDLSVHW